MCKITYFHVVTTGGPGRTIWYLPKADTYNHKETFFLCTQGYRAPGRLYQGHPNAVNHL